MARNIIFETLTTEVIKSDKVWQGYLAINDNKNINSDLINIIDNINIYALCEDDSEIELSITKKEVNTESALKSFNCEFDNGFIRTDSITNVAFSMSSKLTPVKFVFYIEAQDIPVRLKSGSLRSGNNSNDISKIKLSNTTYNIKDTTARDGLLTKQDTLVSGTNIKTINNNSIIGSGNIDTDKVFIATKNITTYSQLVQAVVDNKVIVIDDYGSAYAPAMVNLYYADPEYFTLTFYTDLNMRITYKVIDGKQQWVLSQVDLQPKLVSGTNIKTINNTSLLGSGNLTVGGDTNVIESISVNGTAQTITNKNVDLTIPTNTGDLTNNGDGTQGSLYATQSWVQTYIASLDGNNIGY